MSSQTMDSIWKALTPRPYFQRPSASFILRYGIPALLVIFSAWIRNELGLLAHDSGVISIFLFPVIVSAWFGGFGPGIFATLLGAFAAQTFFVDDIVFDFSSRSQLLSLGIYAFDGVLLSALAELFQRALGSTASTEAKLRTAYENLETTEARTKSMVDNVVDAIFTLNENQQIETWNKAAEKIFGYAAFEVIGQRIEMVIRDPLSDGAHPYFHSGQKAAFHSGREVVGRRKDGNTFPLDLALNEFDWHGKTYTTAIARDITERIRSARELVAAKDAAEAASRAKTQFLANMSHEMRTPLSVILGFTDLGLGVESSEADRKQTLMVIQKNAKHLLLLIDELLDLSKIEAGRLELERTKFALSDVIDDLSATVAFKAREKQLSLTIESEGPVPTQIHSDALRLRQVLVNLVGNAIKFTDSGEIRVIMRSRIPDDKMAPMTLEFEVRDSGIGIAKDQQSRLFKPFAQADSSMARRFGGTGLGLALSRKFAQALGGDLILQSSEPGKGSSFLLTILNGPRAEEEMRTISRQSLDIIRTNWSSRAPEIVRDPMSLDGLSVLLVEDSPDNRAVVSRYLAKAGAQVETATDGNEGVQKAIHLQPDIVLMDIQMPDKDGHTATAELRQHGFSKPIVAVTAHAMKEERDRSLQNGFDEYLTKPVKRAELVSAIRRLVPA